MKNKSAEDVLKNTFKHLDKVVGEKKAEKDPRADRNRDAETPRRRKKALRDTGKSTMDVAGGEVLPEKLLPSVA